MFADMVKKTVVPIMGDGKYRFQPVSVATVAQGFEKALELEESQGKTLDVGGPDNVTFDEIMDTLARVLGKTIENTPAGVPLTARHFSTSARAWLSPHHRSDHHALGGQHLRRKTLL